MGSWTPQKPSQETKNLIPARMLNQFVYCPRLCYIEWVQGQFIDNAFTMEGNFQHRRVDEEKGEIPEEIVEIKKKATSVLLSSEKSSLIAKMDLLHVEGEKALPVEYKRGKKPKKIWDSDKVQLCAQGLILKDNGYDCDHGVLYFAESRERVKLDFTPEEIEKTLRAKDELLYMVKQGGIPPPLEDNPKCMGCSLAGVCLPDEVNLIRHEKKEKNVRRLVPARIPPLPVYVQEQGAYVKKQGEEIIILKSGEIQSKTRIIDISQVCLLGNIQITTQAVRELNIRGIPVCYFSFGGWFTGLTQGLSHNNVELRLQQYETATDSKSSLELSRYFVQGKIKNSRTFLRRKSKENPDTALKELNRLLNYAKKASSQETLLGIEGAAAKVYYSCFPKLIYSKNKNDLKEFNFSTRNRRPPRDPVNAMLSFVYALLVKDFTVILQSVGFDPMLGFLHKPRYGRPALSLDLVEEFRSILGDSVVIAMINNGEISKKEFIQRANGVALNEKGRKKVIRAYEKRMDTLVNHSLFGYTISYRRILEVQARLLGRYLSEEIDRYPFFATR